MTLVELQGLFRTENNLNETKNDADNLDINTTNVENNLSVTQTSMMSIDTQESETLDIPNNDEEINSDELSCENTDVTMNIIDIQENTNITNTAVDIDFSSTISTNALST